MSSLRTWSEEDGEAEVDGLELRVLFLAGVEEVLRLEVPVEDPAGVAEADGGDEVLEVAARNVLLEAALGDAGEELAAADELHDEVDLASCRHDLMELNNAFVRYQPHGCDLTPDLLREPNLEHLLLVQNLYGDTSV